MNLRVNTLLLVLALAASFAASAQVSMAITVAPPPLPDYAQPQSPGGDYIWSPGYWAWAAADGDYYWVPGTWVRPPNVGDLWTPGYWAYEGNDFVWHVGYWGAAVGFYGGLDYGYGYNGKGYQGGHWNHNHFVYTPHTAPYGRSISHVSFNGGADGMRVKQPGPGGHSKPIQKRAPSEAQVQHEHAAVSRSEQRATGEHEHPMVAATPRPMAFDDPGAEHVRTAPPQPKASRSVPEVRNGLPPQSEASSRHEH